MKMRMLWRIARTAGAPLAVVILCAALASAQTLSPEEQRIADYVDAHSGEALQLLERVTNVESATENLLGVKRVGQIFKTEFESLGMTAKWTGMPVEMNRAGHLFAEAKGTRGRRLLLIGHLDTVLQGKRFARDGQLARGNGTVDMKGGDVVILFALKALHKVGLLRGSRIIVALTGDEENVGQPVET